jgi:hypothetical protein
MVQKVFFEELMAAQLFSSFRALHGTRKFCYHFHNIMHSNLVLKQMNLRQYSESNVIHFLFSL